VPVGVTGHRTQRPRGQVGAPGPHPAQTSSPLDPGRTVANVAASGPSDRAAGRGLGLQGAGGLGLGAGPGLILNEVHWVL
jgi:hypothetical protein